MAVKTVGQALYPNEEETTELALRRHLVRIWGHRDGRILFEHYQNEVKNVLEKQEERAAIVRERIANIDHMINALEAELCIK